jgi:hypothetical protein
MCAAQLARITDTMFALESDQFLMPALLQVNSGWVLFHDVI